MRSLDSSKNFEAGLYIFFKFREITILISCQFLEVSKSLSFGGGSLLYLLLIFHSVSRFRLFCKKAKVYSQRNNGQWK